MTGEITRGRERKVPIRALAYIAIVWGILVCGVLAWQAYTYRGVFAALAEWQFREWQRMFPVATIALLTFLLELPFIVLIALKLRYRRRKFGPAKGKLVFLRGTLLARIFAVMSAIALFLSLILTIMGLSIGTLSDKPITNFSLDSNTNETDNFVRARGLVRTDRIGYYRERFLIVGRDLWLAPLMASEDDSAIRAFVEVHPESQAREPQYRDASGVLRRSAIPGGLRRLYENEGYSVVQPAYVIFSSRASARWPFLSAAADLAIMALLFFVTFAALIVHARRIKKREDQATPQTEPAIA